MNKVQRMAAEAKQSAALRGHKLGRFEYHYSAYGRVQAGAVCQVCGRRAFLDSNPQPNGIDVYGEAVAVGCDKSDREVK